MESQLLTAFGWLVGGAVAVILIARLIPLLRDRDQQDDSGEKASKNVFESAPF